MYKTTSILAKGDRATKSIIKRITLTTILLLAFAVSSAYAATGRGLDIKSKEDLNHKSGKLGAYRALVIGINNYQDKKIEKFGMAARKELYLYNF
jgi:hypothetical protein